MSEKMTYLVGRKKKKQTTLQLSHLGVSCCLLPFCDVVLFFLYQYYES